MNNGLGSVITESHVFKRHGACYRTDRCKVAFRAFLRFIEKFEHALRGGNGLLKSIGDGGKLRDRLSEIAHVLDEGLDIADFDYLFHRQVTAQNTNDDVPNVAHELHHRLHDTGEKL